MVRNSAKLQHPVILVVFLCFVWSCARWGSKVPPPPPIQQCADLPAHSGPKHIVKVVEIGIPLDEIERYPALGENQVGRHLNRILAQAASDSDRFQLVSNQVEILSERVLEIEKRQNRGLLLFMLPSIYKGPEVDYFLSAVVYSFVACSPEGTVSLLHKQISCRTSIRVQVEITNLGEITVPGSARGSVAHVWEGPLWGPNTAFDPENVIRATELAVPCALRNAIQAALRKGILTENSSLSPSALHQTSGHNTGRSSRSD